MAKNHHSASVGPANGPLEEERTTAIEVMTVGSRLDGLAPGSIHYKILALICLATFVDFFDLTMGGAIAGSLLQSGWSTLALNSMFFSAAGLGAAVGVLAAGYLADRFGRLISLQLSLGVLTLGTVWCAFAMSMEQLILARVFAALGMGGIPTVGYVYLSEMLPPQIRGSWISGGGVLVAFSTTFAALASYYLLPLGLWREMFVLPAVAAVALILMVRRLPESPRWLAANGMESKANRALALMISGAGRHKGGRGHPSPMQTSGNTLSGELEPGKGISFTRRFLIAAALAVSAVVVSNSFITWLPTILMNEGTVAEGLGDNFLINLGAPVGTIIGFFMADRIGRKNGIGIVALAGIVLSLASAFVGRDSGLVQAAFLLMSVINLICTLVLGIYLPELFSTRARARGTSFALTIARISLILAPFVVALLIEGSGRVGVMLFIGGCFLVIAAVTALLGPETANRPLLEE